MHRFTLAAVLALTTVPAAAATPASTNAMTTTSPATTAPTPADPFLWLEEVQGDQALAWARARNTESAAVLDASPGFALLEQRLLAILDAKERIPHVEKLGRWYYNFWKDAANPRGLWRRTTLEEYRKPQPAWVTVLDVDALGAAEKENWVWHGASCLRPAYRRCMVRLSRGGADASEVREFDLETRAFVPNGFTLPEAKSVVAWLDADTLYVGTDFGPGSLTSSGYPRVARRWKRGTPLAGAEPVLEGKLDDVSVTAWRDQTRGFERDFVQRAMTFYTSEFYLLKNGAAVKLDKPDSCATTGRWGATPGRRARCWPSRWRNSSAATGASTCSSSRASAPRWPTSRRPATTSWSTNSTTSAIASTCSPPAPAAGSATHCEERPSSPPWPSARWMPTRATTTS
jgi:prolyl oligopeptidase